MFSRFFTLLIIPQDKHKKVFKLRIHWLVSLLLLIALAGLGYFFTSIYYQVFVAKKTLVNLDKISADNQSLENQIDQLNLTQIENYIALDLLNSSQEFFINNRNLNLTNQATANHSKKLDEDKLTSQARAGSILDVIEIVRQTQSVNQNLLEFYHYLASPQNYLTSVPSLRPLQGIVLGEFGSSGRQFFELDGPLHGIVLGSAKSGPIVAAADGIVVASDISDVFGEYVEIYHTFGIISRYYNLEQIAVNVGDRVSKGQKIAQAALNIKTNSAYLYYQILYYGIPQNPLVYFEQQ